MRKRRLITFGGPYSNHMLATLWRQISFSLKALVCFAARTGVYSDTLRRQKLLVWSCHVIELAYKTCTVYQITIANTTEFYLAEESWFTRCYGASEILLLAPLPIITRILHVLLERTLCGLTMHLTNQKVIGVSCLKFRIPISFHLQTTLLS